MASDLCHRLAVAKICGGYKKSRVDSGRVFRYHSFTMKHKLVPPKPIGKSTDPFIISNEFHRRTSGITDPVTFIVTNHLFTEHWLNRILEKFCPRRDLTRYDYFKKLEIIYCIEKISHDQFHNLCKLNDLRVAVAHKIDYDLTKMDLDYRGCHPTLSLSKSKPSYEPNSGNNYILYILGIVWSVTYAPLHNHCIINLGFKAEPLQ
jgi:hypothetical protein